MSARNANSAEIKSLTKRTGEGELYVRRPDAQLQIEKIVALDRSQILAMLGGNHKRGESEYLLDETIVYLLREARINNDNAFVEELYKELNIRIWKLLKKFHTGNEADFEDLGQKVGMSILEKIFDTESNSADFAQVQFGSFVISEAKAVWKGNLVRLKREQQIFETERDDEKDEKRLENIPGAGELSPESRLIIIEGINKLAPHHQTVAAMLAGGFQIESNDENEITISSHLGVSSRTVRNWIKEMRKVLDGYQGEAKK
jgi:DNA-directed RNA polymerase specialized sigma24 family protein